MELTKLKKHTVSVEAKNKKGAIKKLRKMMLPKFRKHFVPEKVELTREVKEYSVTWRPKKTKKKRRKK